MACDPCPQVKTMFFRFTDKTVEELQTEAEDDEMLQVSRAGQGRGCRR
jgi:hypothetical protein